MQQYTRNVAPARAGYRFDFFEIKSKLTKVINSPTIPIDELFHKMRLNLLFDLKTNFVVVHQSFGMSNPVYSWNNIWQELRSVYSGLVNCIPSWLEFENLDKIEYLMEFDIENDDEMVSSYKLLALAVHSFRKGEPWNPSLIMGFFKHFYCHLDVQMEKCLDLRRHVNNNSQLPKLCLGQFMNIPDWKIGILLILSKLVHGYFLNDHFAFFLFIVQYYNVRNWEKRFIDMTDMDYKLLNELFTLPIREVCNVFRMSLAKVAYQHFQADSSKIQALQTVMQKQLVVRDVTFVQVLSKGLAYDIFLIENESSRNIPENTRNMRIRKVFALCKLANGFTQFSQEVVPFNNFLLGLLKGNDDQITLECFDILNSVSSIYPSLDKLEFLATLTELFGHKSEIIRENSYKWCTAILEKETLEDSSYISSQILDTLRNTPILSDSLISLTVNAFRFYGGSSLYKDKSVEFFERFFTMLLDAINQNDKYQVERVLGVLPAFITNLNNQVIGPVILKLPLNTLFDYTISNGIDIPTLFLNSIIELDYFIMCKDLLLKILTRSNDKTHHIILADLLNDHFVETGTLLIPQDLIENLIHTKLKSLESISDDYELSAFVYKVAHFHSNIYKIASSLRSCPVFMYKMLDIKERIPDIVVLNYFKLLEINLDRSDVEVPLTNISIITQEISEFEYPFFIIRMIDRVRTMMAIDTSSLDDDFYL